MRALRWLGRGMQLLLTVALSVLLACNLYLMRGAAALWGGTPHCLWLYHGGGGLGEHVASLGGLK